MTKRLAQRAGIKTVARSASRSFRSPTLSKPTKVGKLLIEDPDPAAVLRRPIPAPAGAARVSHSRLGRDDLLHDDVVPPVVAEVVAVRHLCPLGPGHLGEGGGGLILPFRPVVIVVRRAELTAHRLEGVQVIAVPILARPAIFRPNGPGTSL